MMMMMKVMMSLMLLAPPAYEECVTTGHVDIREEQDNEYVRGELRWRPRYPMYRQLSEPQGPQLVAPTVNVDNV